MNIPDWTAGALLYVHLDERGPSVTLGFEHDRPAGHHHLRFLVFDGVEQVRARGLGSPAPHTVTAAPADGGRHAVTVRGPALDLAFRAQALRVPDPTVLDHVRRVRAADPRIREAAAREAAAADWQPDEARYLAEALAAAVVAENDPAAREAEARALLAPPLSVRLDEHTVNRLANVPAPTAALRSVLARNSRLQLCGPAEPAGAATIAVVRCMRGVVHTGLTLRTVNGDPVVLERIELPLRAVDRLSPAWTARVLLSGPAARTLAEWDCLDGDPEA
jgi:hypothetical protein